MEPISITLPPQTVNAIDAMGPNRSATIREAMTDFFAHFLTAVDIEPTVRMKILRDPDCLASWTAMILAHKAGDEGIRVFRDCDNHIVNVVDSNQL